MSTLQQLIDQGSKAILEGRSNSPEAAIYMAYHAGLSAGDIHLRNQWIDADKIARAAASNEHMRHVASRHIPTPPERVVNPEYFEILSFDYAL